MKHWISRFNPVQMEGETVLRLAVGRDKLLEQVLADIGARIDAPRPDRHILLTGPRGAGKSYFLRLLEIHCRQSYGERASFVLLPEEQPNLFSINNLVANILERLGDQEVRDLTSTWQEDVADAGQAVNRLMSRWRELKPEAALLVVAVENFDAVLAAAFNRAQQESFLRKVLQTEPSLMLVATAVEDSFDNDSTRRLYRSFAHLALPGWTPDEHARYLGIRAEMAGQTAAPTQRSRIRAYAHFTGGNPRIGAALADLMLQQIDPHGAAVNLHTLVDELTDYFRNLWERIPANSRKLLDALIRNGEPCSQSALATRVQAQQNQIARAFQWLRDMGYVREIDAETKGRDKLYQASDRLFVQFYRLRYIHSDAATPLATMSDFLTELYDTREKLDVARKFLDEGHREDARLMMRLGLRDYGVRDDQLGVEALEVERLADVHALLAVKLKNDGLGVDGYDFGKEILARFPTEDRFRQVYEDMLRVLATRGGSDGRSSGDSLIQVLSICKGLSPQLHVLAVSGWLTMGSSQSKSTSDDSKPATDRMALNSAWLEGRDHTYEVTYQSFAAETMWLALQRRDGCHTATALLQILHPQLLADNAKVLAAEMRRQHDQQLWKWIVSGDIKDELLSLHQVAVTFWESIGNEKEVAWNKNEVGASLARLERYEDALVVLHDANDLLSRCGDQQSISRNLEWTAKCQSGLGRFNEALSNYLAALARRRKERSKQPIAWNLGMIGWNLAALTRYEEALAAHQEALGHLRKKRNGQSAAWHLGQMARCCLNLGRTKDAWALLDGQSWEFSQSAYDSLQQLGDAVRDQNDRAAAFAIAVSILQGIASRAERYQPDRALRILFVNFLGAPFSHELLRDILEEAIIIFGSPISTTANILRTVLDYMGRCEDKEDWLARQDPDLAITVRAILEGRVWRGIGVRSFTGDLADSYS